MGNQPNSKAGRIRAVLDEFPHLSNWEVAERAGFSPLDEAGYVGAVRNKFGYDHPRHRRVRRVGDFTVHLIVAFFWDRSCCEFRRTVELPFAPIGRIELELGDGEGFEFNCDEEYPPVFNVHSREFTLYRGMSFGGSFKDLDDAKLWAEANGFQIGKVEEPDR